MAVLDKARDWSAGTTWGTYNIQRTYLDFLEELHIREETVPSADGSSTRGELVFYNLGKFSQAISDFEQIYFRSDPQNKYGAFAGWLAFQAPDYYAESDADVGYATPDAVTIATVHQAKGMQWPAVFVPALRKNRFPSKRQGGLNVFHVIPEQAVPDADRYRGTEDDEIRLFYVAVTRAQKYLALTYSPGDSQLYRARSPFFDFATRNPYVLTAEIAPPATRTEPRARHETPDVTLSFSDLKYFFECPYQFKLRFMYGFNAPIHEALGYGKSVHDVMAEIHKRAITGDIVSDQEAEGLVNRHLNAPFAYPDCGNSCAGRCQGSPPVSRREPGSATADPLLRAAGPGARRPRHHRRRPDRPDPAAGHQRDLDRRLQVQRPRAGRRHHQRSAARLRRRLPGADRREGRPGRGPEPRREGSQQTRGRQRGTAYRHPHQDPGRRR